MIRVSILTVSDSVEQGTREDRSGARIACTRGGLGLVRLHYRCGER